MTRSRFSGGIVQTIEKEVGPNDASGLWGLNDIAQRVGGNDFPGYTPQPTQDYVAKGALTDGSMVVLNSDDTVSVVYRDDIAESMGSTGEITASGVGSGPDVLSSTYDPINEKVVVAWKDSTSNSGMVALGTVSGGTISFGAPQTFYSPQCYTVAISYDPSAGKILFVFRGNASWGHALVGTISGNTISFGALNEFYRGSSGEFTLSYDPDQSAHLVVWGGASTIGFSRFARISGTSSNFIGSSTHEFTSDRATHLSCSYDSTAQRHVIFYGDGGNSTYGTAIVARFDSDDVSTGTPVVFHSTAIQRPIASAYLPNENKVVAAYTISGGIIGAIVGTVSGESISFGSEITEDFGGTYQMSCVYNPIAGGVDFVLSSGSTSQLRASLLTVNGDTPSFGPLLEITASSSGAINSVSIAYDSVNQKMISSYGQGGTFNGYKSTVYFPAYEIKTNLTATNFIGVSAGDYADGATATIQTKGATDDAQSGLTTGEDYYVQIDGTIETTPDLPSVFAGNALAPNKILVKDNYAGTDTTKVIASGALTDGSTVVLNEDGTVSVVSGSTEDEVGTTAVFSDSVRYTAVEYDPVAEKIVLLYSDGNNSNVGTGVVGTVSGDNITFGTPVVFNSFQTDYIDIVYHPVQNKHFLAYKNINSSIQTGVGRVATVSGDTITFSSDQQFHNARSRGMSLVYDPNVDKIALTYTRELESNYSYAMVVTVSGESVSYGSQVGVSSGSASIFTRLVYHPATNQVVMTQRGGTAAKAYVGSISGTTISFGAGTDLNDTTTSPVSSDVAPITYDPVSDKMVAAYRSGNDIYLNLGTVTSGSISFGTPINSFTASGVSPWQIVYDHKNGKVVLFGTGSSTELFAIGGTVSGNTVTFGSPIRYNDNNVIDLSSVYDPDSEKVIFAYKDNGRPNDGLIRTYSTDVTTTNLTANNFLGFSDGNYSDGEAAVIQTQGATDDAQSGLFPADQYFVQIDGSIDTTPDTPEVFAGTALSPTEIVIKEESSGGSATLVATGALDDGSSVILNSDGTVSVVAGIDGVLPTFGSADSFDGSAPTSMNSIYEPVSGKVLIAYRDTGNNNYGTLQVGTVTGDRIIFGAGNVFASSNTIQYNMCLLGAGTGKFAIAYRDIGQGGGTGTMMMGTMSGSSVSFSGTMLFNGGSVQSSTPMIDYSPDLDGVLIAYKNNGTSVLAAGFASVSGNSFVMTGTMTVDSSSINAMSDCIFDPSTGKWVILYKTGSSQYEHAVHATVAANKSTITIGTPYNYASAGAFQGGAYVGNGEIVVIRANSAGAYAYLAKVDGDVVSFSEPKLFAPKASPFSISADLASNEFMVAYQDTTTSDHLYAVSGKVSSGNISFTDPTPVYEDRVSYMSVAYDTVEEKYSIAYRHSSPGSNGEAVVTTGNGSPASTNLTANNFLGFSDGAYADGETATIHTRGSVSDEQSGLEATEEYYVQGNGSLEKTPDNPSVFAGTSIGPTKIVVKGSSDGQTSLQGVASGALANGDMVVLNEDNTVSVVGGTLLTQGVGSAVVFDTSGEETTKHASAFDPTTNTVLISYVKTGVNNTVYSVAGSVSGDTITFGSPVSVGGPSNHCGCCFDTVSNKLVVAYSYNNKLLVRLGTVSGDTISFGTSYQVSSSEGAEITCVYNPVVDKTVISYGDVGNSTYGTVSVGTITGNTIIFGTPVIFQSSNLQYPTSTVASQSGSMVFSYRNSQPASSIDRGEAIVGTISGSSISFGTPTVFYNNTCFYLSIVSVPNSDKVILSYADAYSAPPQKGNIVSGLVSGNSITFDSPVEFTDHTTGYIDSVYHPNGSVVINYHNHDNTTSSVVEVTVSNGNLEVGTPSQFSNATKISSSSVYDPSSSMVVISYADGSSNVPTAVTYTTSDTAITNLTATNFLGVSDADYADGETATIQTKGSTDDAQTGLVSGESYFVQIDGSIETTADDPRVFAGTASSSTEILVKGTDPNQPSTDMIATGELSDGSMVMVNTDGTVSVVKINPEAESFGPASSFTNDLYASNELASIYDPATKKVIVAYQRDSSRAGMAVVGTVSGGDITFGTPAAFQTNVTEVSFVNLSMDQDSGKVLFVYRLNVSGNLNGCAIVGTISGDSISFTGATSTFNTSRTDNIAVSYDESSKKHLISYADFGNSEFANVVVATVSGNSVSFSSPTVFNSSQVRNQMTSTYNPVSNLHVVGYVNSGSTTVLAIQYETGTLSFASPVIHLPAAVNRMSSIYDTASGKVVLVYQNDNNGDFGTAVTIDATMSGVSFGPAVVFNNASTRPKVTYNTSNNEILISYTTASSPQSIQVITGTVTGDVITFGTPELIEEGSYSKVVSAYDVESGNAVVFYPEGSNGTARVFTGKASNLTATNFIGVSDGDYADGETATVQLRGAVDDAQSGLTPDATYYVQGDGSINTTVDDPSVLAGTAIDSNLLLIKE